MGKRFDGGGREGATGPLVIRGNSEKLKFQPVSHPKLPCADSKNGDLGFSIGSRLKL